MNLHHREGPNLRIVPPDGGGPSPDPEPDDLPPASDSENLEARVFVNRLARHLKYVASEDYDVRDLPTDDQVVVAVFDQEALPELAALMLRRRP